MPGQVQEQSVCSSDILRLLQSPGEMFTPGLRQEEGEESTEKSRPGKDSHGEPGVGGEDSQLGDVW